MRLAERILAIGLYLMLGLAIFVIIALLRMSPAGSPEERLPQPVVATPSALAARDDSTAFPPAAVASMPASGSLGTPVIGGIVGYALPSYGPHYLAMRLPPGTHVHICGPAGCVYAVVNDFGPVKRLHRLGDLSYRDFGHVCGDHAQGLCRAQAVLLELPPELPPTDTR